MFFHDFRNQSKEKKRSDDDGDNKHEGQHVAFQRASTFSHEYAHLESTFSVKPGGTVSPLRLAASTLYIKGMKKSVEKVATDNPPITALPIAEFCPVPSDIGIMPRTMAVAVIQTGLKR